MKKRGFTLVELVLTIAILGIMVGTLAPWMINTMKGYDLITTRRQMLSQARAGFERMMLEILLIPGRPQVITTGNSSFTFQYPVGTNITYSLSGTNLMRNQDVLVQNVTALSFVYYDQAGNTTTTAANVRSVKAQISVTTTNAAQPLTIMTRVFIRNTGNNYANFTMP